LRGWQHLTWIERSQLFQAFFLLPLMIPGLRLLGLQRMQKLMVLGFPRNLDSARKRVNNNKALPECQNITRIVNIAVVHSPIYSTCLRKSLVLWWLLGQAGFDADLRLGAQKEEGKFEAHAWVEYRGTVLNDTQDVKQRFATFDAPVNGTSKAYSP
jgi:hypothetical protein